MAALMGGMSAPHRPVLLRETTELLEVQHGGLFVDGTLGLGGHSEAILEAATDSRVIGIDRDHEALDLAMRRERRSSPYSKMIRAISASERCASNSAAVSSSPLAFIRISSGASCRKLKPLCTLSS